jgi:CrcB protein
MTTALLVFVGGAIGAPARYLTDRFVQSRHDLRFPLGTLTVNLIGCLLLGVFAGEAAHAGWSAHTLAFLGTGFCGGLTTFSAFSYEVVDLARFRLWSRSALYVVISATAGIALAELGWLLT